MISIRDKEDKKSLLQKKKVTARPFRIVESGLRRFELTTNLGDGETNVSHNTKENRNVLKKDRNEKQPPEIDIPAEFMKEANKDKATPFNVDRDFCDDKREDYISDKDREMLEQDEIELQVRPGRYKYDSAEVKRWEKKGYEVIARLQFGNGLLVILKKSKKNNG